MKVSIIGAGNTGLALAVHLLASGHAPLVYTRSEAKARLLTERGLTVTGRFSDTSVIPATTDLSEAARYGEVIVICTWANAHREVFDRLYAAAEGRPLHVLVLNGNWGAVEAFAAWRATTAAARTTAANHIPESDESAGTADGSQTVPARTIAATTIAAPMIAKVGSITESTGMPYVAHLEGTWSTQTPPILHVTAVKTTITVASITSTSSASNETSGSRDGKDSAPVDDLITDLYDQVEYASSVFETSLCAPNPIIHAPMCLLNMTQIEQGKPFHMLTDGFSEHAERLIAHIDGERHALAEALDVPYIPIVKQLNGFWDSDYPTLTELFRNNPVYREVMGPDSTTHRFIQEDIPYGIAPLVSLGRLINVPTPTCAALLTLYSDYFNVPYQGPTFANDLIAALRDR
ncbi:NAD/NADP octopine/nopaline dehydrogenase family protein [Bifidobacterium simiarum]|uniref:NAD/NADP octopine/nopaline dehydrogenase n=1 Tax=Bifidobacterium simiarum TaxID=2045441 RepID=A0A2M9HCA1_9BIFI|nr:NAD/NADP octopine/nopaline dehydrogenase family protein [Bifidobacterium simiarum]PJM74422.1 NAD/NADP octopine/nopaline dehydrogenase [Bifidobacterium simiarum]